MDIIHSKLTELLQEYLKKNALEIASNQFLFQPTNKDHQGDVTLTVFPLAKILKTNPEVLANELGQELLKSDFISNFSVIKGFLNLELSNSAWRTLSKNLKNITYKAPHSDNIVLEYCGPNTNKPLHIGHLRNLFLGYSVGQILKETGHDVKIVNINNDRGIAICKSMIAYDLYGDGETPKSSGLKGDFLIGKYYVKYNSVLTDEINNQVKDGHSKEEAEANAPIALAAQNMLIDWENGKPEVLALWKKMNDWFYEGLHQTLSLLNIKFDKEYYESAEYKKGKEIVEIGFKKGAFQMDETGGIFVDLTDKGLDKKFLQRSNGTSLYITQDMAVVRQRYEDYKMNRMIYTVGDEQNYHFKVLGFIMEALNEPFSSSIYHLSYGMVTGKDGSKYKSREGTTADADTVLEEIIEEAKKQTLDSEKGSKIEPAYLDELSRIIGLGAARYTMLKINPKKSIPYDPKESVQLNGDTGTFIQYTYTRTNKIISDFDDTVFEPELSENFHFEDEEKALIEHIHEYKHTLERAEKGLDPSEIAQYSLQLAKLFNRFYHEHSILKADSEETKTFRIYLTDCTRQYIMKCFELLGMQAPKKM
jgi:arginyl-tRNA synthetase